MTQMTLQAVRQLIANDSYAITFQSMGQYRGALLRHFDSLTDDQAAITANHSAPTVAPEQVAQWADDLTEDDRRLVARGMERWRKGIAGECRLPPTGWHCTRMPGHEGPCAAVPQPSEAVPLGDNAARLLSLAANEYSDAGASVQHGASQAEVPEWARLAVTLLTGAAQEQAEPVALMQALTTGIPLQEPVYIAKALRAQREARVSLGGGTGPSAAAFLVNIQLTPWTYTKETAGAYAEGYNRALKDYRAALLDVAASPVVRAQSEESEHG